jgi:hypothetical protein
MREIRARVLTGAVGLLLAASLPALAAGPPTQAGVLSDGTRFEISGDQLLLTDRAGRKAPARDGTYRIADGGTLVVQNGRLVLRSATPPTGPKAGIQSGPGSPLTGGGGGSSAASSKSGPPALKPIAPDLRVAAPTTKTGLVGWGYPLFSMEWTVQNAGDADSPGTTLRLTCQVIAGGPCPDGLAGEVSVPPLPAKTGSYVVKRESVDPAYEKAGNSFDKSTTFRKFRVNATVDPAQKIGEQSEGNNTSTYTYQYDPSAAAEPSVSAKAALSTKPAPGQPKDSVAAGDPSGKGSFPTPPNPDLVPELEQGKSFVAGQQVWLIVRNKGDVNAGPFSVKVVCQGPAPPMRWSSACGQMGLSQGPYDNVTFFPVSGVAAGSFQAVTLLKPPPSVSVTLDVLANPNHAVPEKSYGNNTLTLTSMP